jgi:hypothetical protein|nr:MAG TPA: hypothetical protein [Caudoviricetes sp.]
MRNRDIDYMKILYSGYHPSTSELREAAKAEKIAFDAEVEREHIAREKEDE